MTKKEDKSNPHKICKEDQVQVLVYGNSYYIMFQSQLNCQCIVMCYWLS